jgi:hypothetical protein
VSFESINSVARELTRMGANENNRRGGNDSVNRKRVFPKDGFLFCSFALIRVNSRAFF